ncbi:hypothetical protein N9T93_00450 [Flavobacteriaceae bacterium]|nr:hypothetical protein [Flavobacteriaceae bacterium]
MGRIAGVPNRLTTQMKQKLQELIDDIITDIEVEDLNTNQKLKLLQISLQYVLPRLKHSKENTSIEPSEVQVNIVTTTDELDRLNKVNAYEKEHNVKIL